MPQMLWVALSTLWELQVLSCSFRLWGLSSALVLSVGACKLLASNGCQIILLLGMYHVRSAFHAQLP